MNLRAFPDLAEAVLVIHTKNNGDIAESASGRGREELEKLRKESREIDRLDNRHRAVVSVMMLREGWDVQSGVLGRRPRSFPSPDMVHPPLDAAPSAS